MQAPSLAQDSPPGFIGHNPIVDRVELRPVEWPKETKHGLRPRPYTARSHNLANKSERTKLAWVDDDAFRSHTCLLFAAQRFGRSAACH